MRPRSALRYSLLLLALAASAAIQAQPKTLAVCTEAAPEGFDPARYPPATPSTPQPIRCTTRWPRSLRAAPR